MSLTRRFMNVARAEALSAAGRARTAASELLGSRPRPFPRSREDAEYARLRSEVEAEVESGLRDRPRTGREPPEIRRYYANLELPLGAPADEVKAAYRRLMRRYHPDKHRDPERARAATELVVQLRQAHDGLMRWLGA